MLNNLYKKSAFTLLEIILVVALIAISAGIVAPIYYSAKSNDDFNNSFSTLVGSLRRAQILSMASLNDSSWGLKIIDNNIIIFKGENYLNRSTDYDEIISVNRNIRSSGLDEVVFSKYTGKPNLSGDISWQLNTLERTLSINEIGIVDY